MLVRQAKVAGGSAMSARRLLQLLASGQPYANFTSAPAYLTGRSRARAKGKHVAVIRQDLPGLPAEPSAARGREAESKLSP